MPGPELLLLIQKHVLPVVDNTDVHPKGLFMHVRAHKAVDKIMAMITRIINCWDMCNKLPDKNAFTHHAAYITLNKP